MCVARKALKRLRDEETYSTASHQHGPPRISTPRRTLQSRGLLCLSSEPVSAVTLLICARLLVKDLAHERLRGARELRAEVLVRREDTLGLLAPGHDRALALDLLAEEADEHVETAEGEEEEGGDEREVVDVVREDRRANEALEDAERAQAEVGAQHGEVRLEEGHGPADLGEDEDDDLEDDEQPVDHGPERACGLVGNCAPAVVEVRGQRLSL